MLPVPRRGLCLGYYLRRAGIIALMLAIAAGGVAGVRWSASGVIDLRADQRVWARGTETTEVEVAGKVRAKGFRWIAAWYDLTVTYRIADGTLHKHELDLSTMFGSVDDDRAPVVHYDPAAPDRFALSWAVEASGGRWRSAIIGVVVFALVIFAGGFGAYAIASDTRALGRAARTGAPIIAHIKSATVLRNDKGQPTGKARFALVAPATDGGAERPWSEDLDESRARPLYADRDHATAFALLATGDLPPILLRDDLYPLSATAAERAAVIAAATAHLDGARVVKADG